MFRMQLNFGELRQWLTCDILNEYSNMDPRLSVQNLNSLSFFCLTIPKTDLDPLKTPSKFEVCPESLGVMLKYRSIEGDL